MFIFDIRLWNSLGRVSFVLFILFNHFRNSMLTCMAIVDLHVKNVSMNSLNSDGCVVRWLSSNVMARASYRGRDELRLWFFVSAQEVSQGCVC